MRTKNLFNKKGVSPVIATVLLIVMVVVIGIIIFMWFRGMNEEVITKFGGENIELVCEDVSFRANYNEGMLYIVNEGNVPIYGMKLKISSKAYGYDTFELEGFNGLSQGETFTSDITLKIVNAETLAVIPVLLGSSRDGQKSFTCDEKQYGYEIDL
ncbi:MAG: archaellin/type IV pilin N-terminal domain-containing protein [archaeon]